MFPDRKLMLIATLSLFSTIPLAHGGQKIRFDGVQYTAGRFETVELESGHTYSFVKEWRAIHAAEDLSSVTHLTRVECFGYIDARSDGSFSADGYCNHWDRDGDHWVGHWWNSSQMSAGQFEVVSGSGKYTGASGGGTADCKFLNQGADPQAACNISGMLELQ